MLFIRQVFLFCCPLKNVKKPEKKERKKERNNSFVFSLVYFVGGLDTPPPPQPTQSGDSGLQESGLFCFSLQKTASPSRSQISTFLNNGKPITNFRIVSAADICFRTIPKLTSKNFKSFYPQNFFWFAMKSELLSSNLFANPPIR